mmetsp:Transcript_38357/g.93177  ORF Transcript_38357/g.93177 Transcript_38357/m.93177 type:complete len:105 (+) Transcript_38357:272-586(+)
MPLATRRSASPLASRLVPLTSLVSSPLNRRSHLLSRTPHASLSHSAPNPFASLTCRIPFLVFRSHPSSLSSARNCLFSNGLSPLASLLSACVISIRLDSRFLTD